MARDDHPGGFIDAAFYDNLDGAFDEIWSRLTRGVVDRRSGFHTVQVATVAADGAPRVRTVVLRGVDREAGTLRFHTDARSVKISHLDAQPQVEVCAYDPKAKMQVRVAGLAALHEADAVAASAWAATKPHSRVCYRAPMAPGAEIASPGAADPGPEAREPADPESGRARFRVVVVRAARIDWLYLAARGHRRAQFTRSPDGWSAAWLAP